MELINQSNLISSFINETCSLFEAQIEFNRYCMSYHHSVSEKFQNLKILGETLLKMNNCATLPIPKPTNTVFTPSISPSQTQPHQRLNNIDSDYNKIKNRTGHSQVLNSTRANLNNENKRFTQMRQHQSSYYIRYITPESDHYNTNTKNTDNTNKENRHSEDSNSNGYQSSNEQYNIKNESIETNETNQSYSNDINNNCQQNGFTDNFDSGTDGPMTSSSINDGCTTQEDSYSMEFNRVISEQDFSAIEHAKPFKCTECYKTFRMKEELKIHFRVHSGERPFKCDQCDKRFKQSTDLKRHILVHTGEKKYKCPQCGLMVGLYNS